MVKKKYKVNGMHCTACVLMIESELEDIEVNAKCSYARETVEVEFDPKIVNEEKIKQVIKSAGYSLV